MDRDQERGSHGSRGRGRASSTSSVHIPLRPSPTGFRFSPPLLSSSAYLISDGSGSFSSPHRIIHLGDRYRLSSLLSHSEFQNEKKNNTEDDIEHSLDHARGYGARYIRADDYGIGFVRSHAAAGAIYDAIKAYFEQPWPTWHDIPIEVRDRIFSEFEIIFYVILFLY